MPNPTLIDTSYVLALIDRRDRNHPRALELVKEYDNAPMLITDAVLLEIGAAMAAGFRKQAIQVIGEFFGSPNIEVVRLSPELFDRGFDFFKRYDEKEWSLADCISFVVMRDRGIHQALTFDQHFQQAGFAALMREE